MRLVFGARYLRAIGHVVAVAAVLAAAPRPVLGQQPTGQVWQFTYLKALPGRLSDLEEFLDRNWFAMDRRAVAAGHLVDFQLLRGTPADSSWDLVEVTIFRDPAQHAQADSIYRSIYRPAHTRELIRGRDLPELGRIVRSETVHRVAGAPRQSNNR